MSPVDSERAAHLLLQRLAPILLRLGIDVPIAQRLLRQAFVHAVRELTRTSGTRATQSQIALMAGMSRLEVRTILTEKPRHSSSRRSTRADEIVSAWRTNPLFLDARGRPRQLDIKGSRGSFDYLVKKYGRDVTSKTLRDELVSRGMASITGKKLALTSSNDKRREKVVAAESDLRFILSLLEGIELHSGRRSYTTKRITVAAQDKKAIQMLRGIALRRIETVLNSLSELSPIKVRKVSKATQRARRLVITATLSSESED